MAKYQPKVFSVLGKLIQDESINLGDIDTSKIVYMAHLFYKTNRKDWSGIETWDVSNVKNMLSMFEQSNFNGDISKWNVSNVKDMTAMFKGTNFNGDLSKWNTSNVKNMLSMFAFSNFNSDISNWDVSSVKYMPKMFWHSAFNNDISKWDVSNVQDMAYMFAFSRFTGDISKWKINDHIIVWNMFEGSNLLKIKVPKELEFIKKRCIDKYNLTNLMNTYFNRYGKDFLKDIFEDFNLV